MVQAALQGVNMKRKHNTKSDKTRSTDHKSHGIKGQFVSFPKAGEILGIGIATVRTLVKAGTLTTFTYGPGMHPMISLTSVEKLLAKREGKQ